MKTLTLQAPERATASGLVSLTQINNLIWRIRLYVRWFMITTLAAPNKMMKGGVR